MSEYDKESDVKLDEQAATLKEAASQAHADTEELRDSVDDIDTKWNFSADFKDSSFETIYQGNQQVNVFQVFKDKNAHDGPEIVAQKLPFPQKLEQSYFCDLEAIEHYRHFYKTHGWLVIESNYQNEMLISHAIAELVAEDEYCNYFEQQPNIGCEHYIRHTKRIQTSSNSVTKLPISDLTGFCDFLKTREKIQQLSQVLAIDNNVLLLVINNTENPKKIDQIKQLLNHATENPDYAYWQPAVEQSTTSNLDHFDNVDWLGKTMLTLCSWFTSIPFYVFHNIIRELLENKHTPTSDKNADSDGEKRTDIYCEWLNEWLNHPDQVLAKYQLENKVNVSHQMAGVSLKQNHLYASYRKKQLSQSPFLLMELLPVVTRHFFSLSDSDIQRAEVNVFSELVHFQLALNTHRVMMLDTDFLQDTFEKNRYSASNSAQSINRFIEYLAALYQNEHSQVLVNDFVKQLIQQLADEERQLLSHPEAASLLGQSNSLSASKQIQYRYFLFKDKVYATFNILAWSTNLADPQSLSRLESLLTCKLPERFVQLFPLTKVPKIEYFLRARIKGYPQDFIKVLSSSCFKTNDEKPAFPRLTYVFRKYISHLFKKANNPDTLSEQDLNFLLYLFAETEQFSAILWLILDEKTELSQIGDVIQSIVHIKWSILELQQTSDKVDLALSDEIDQQLSDCLNLVARTIERDTCRVIRESLRNQVLKVRDQARDRAMSKEQKQHKLRYKESLAFVRKYFVRKKKENNYD